MDKLAEIRKLMKDRGIDAYIVPSTDSHTAERTTDHWKARAWMSGFTGSSGTLVVMQDMAGIWTDGRYHIQAEKELAGSGIELFRFGTPDIPTHVKFLADKLASGSKVGFDGRTMSTASFDILREKLKEKSIGYHYTEDLVGQIWKDRPPLPSEKAFLHVPPFATTSASKKLETVRGKMKEKGFDFYLVSALDAVAWLLNIRGRDIPNIPMVYAHVLVSATKTHVFIDQSKLEGISGKLTSEGIILHDYDSLPDFLGELKEGKIYYNADATNVLLSETIPTELSKVNSPVDDIIAPLKAVKSDADIANIKNAFIKEGVAMVKTLKWIDDNVADGKMRESDVAVMMTNNRKPQKDYYCDAFSSICAYGENAAQAHYSPGPEGAQIKPDGFLLIDTGGNYLDGTTDTTRTIAVGPLTDEMKRDFTLVLKGHIALDRAIFLKGTTGPAIDVLARLPMWQTGQNYGHGTGHGIGYFLAVHEGPHSIAMRKNDVALVPGMLASNEPGIYKEGRYGIRTECIILVVPKMTTPDGEFYGFENLTHCPIDKRAIQTDMLTPEERDWINSYHKRTRETLTPYLSPAEQAWLKDATEAI